MTDLEQRMRLALAELWLDTELTPLDLKFIADELHASGHNWRTIERICATQVAPVMRHNLEHPAGEWAGIDPDWLEARIEWYQRSAWRRLVAYFRGPSAMRLIRNDWRRLEDLFITIRKRSDVALS